jgi:hypothetical protein
MDEFRVGSISGERFQQSATPDSKRRRKEKEPDLAAAAQEDVVVMSGSEPRDDAVEDYYTPSSGENSGEG